MSYLKNCCSRNKKGSETYYDSSAHEYVCGNCGTTEEDDGEDPENS